jgi:hypothetical protein
MREMMVDRYVTLPFPTPLFKEILTRVEIPYGVFGDPAGVLEKLYSGYLLEHST